MLKLSDRRFAEKRKNKWNKLGFPFLTTISLSKRHSLNCGCLMCKMKTFEKRLDKKRNRIKSRLDCKTIELKDI